MKIIVTTENILTKDHNLRLEREDSSFHFNIDIGRELVSPLEKSNCKLDWED